MIVLDTQPNIGFGDARSIELARQPSILTSTTLRMRYWAVTTPVTKTRSEYHISRERWVGRKAMSEYGRDYASLGRPARKIFSLFKQNFMLWAAGFQLSHLILRFKLKLAATWLARLNRLGDNDSPWIPAILGWSARSIEPARLDSRHLNSKLRVWGNWPWRLHHNYSWLLQITVRYVSRTDSPTNISFY